MGRITVFTANDPHSKQVKAALEKFNLPYTEILLEHDHIKRADLYGTTGSYSVPQVFFNTRLVGGAKETLEELKGWQGDGSYSLLERYNDQIASAPDPSSKLLSIPLSSQGERNEEILQSRTSIVTGASRLAIELPDGTKTSVVDITEKLRNSLIKDEIKSKGVVYKNAFTGKAAVDVFQKAMGVSESEAVAFGRKLVLANILNQVEFDEEETFAGSSELVFRLQCDRQPGVLNSYCVWNKVTSGSCIQSVLKIDALLREIEEECVGDEGKLDFRAVHEHPHYPHFEEAICELQCKGFVDLNDKEKLVFGLNVFHLMVKYAFIKLGIVKDEADRLVFMSKVKFKVGTKLYTFDEWVDKVVFPKGSGKKPVKPISWMNPEADGDLFERCKVILALNAGAHMGSTVSLPFRNFSVENIDKELVIAAHVFLEDYANFEVDRKRNEVKVSKVLSWPRAMLTKSDKKLLTTLVDFLTTAKKLALRRVLDTETFSVLFTDVDYTRNALKYAYFQPSSLQPKKKGVMEKILRRFRPPPPTRNEALRLSTLRNLNILDTLPEERFDRITRMAQATFNVPLVFVSLVEEERQWFKSKQWMCELPAANETGRDVSFCGHTILGGEDEIMLVRDATQDDRFADNPLVTGPLKIRFYAGCNITVMANGPSGPEKVNLGTLCVIDQKPRDFSPEEQRQLRAFAHQIRDELLRKMPQGGVAQ